MLNPFAALRRGERAPEGPPQVLVVWPEYPPAIGGMQVHGVEFARFLHAQRVPFTVVAQAPRNPTEATECAEFDRINGFEARRVLPRGAPFDQTLALLEQTACALGPVRAVFASQVALTPAFAKLRARGVRVVCRSAGNDILRPWVGPCDLAYKVMRKLPYAEQRARLAQNREWVRQASAHCDAVLCNSDWTRERAAAILSCPLAIVLGGVDVDRFAPVDRAEVRRGIGWEQDAEVAFIAARHTLKKGIDTAIEAVALLRERRPKLRLVVAGYGTETDNLRALSEELGVADRVQFAGTLPHALMPRYLAAADLALAPSRDVYDPRRYAIDYETMGRMICEAAACGVPVVASHCAGVPEVVEDGETGLLTRPSDPEGVAAAMDALLSDPARARAMGEKARAWAVERLSFARVNAETLRWLNGEGGAS